MDLELARERKRWSAIKRDLYSGLPLGKSARTRLVRHLRANNPALGSPSQVDASLDFIRSDGIKAEVDKRLEHVRGMHWNWRAATAVTGLFATLGRMP